MELYFLNTRNAQKSAVDEDLIPEIVQLMKQRGKYVTGQTARSLYSIIVANFDMDGFETLLKSEGDLFDFGVQKGRGPGGAPPIANIIRWEAHKRTGISPWAIRESIRQKGTNPRYHDPELLDIAVEAMVNVMQDKIAEGFRKDHFRFLEKESVKFSDFGLN